MTEVKQCPICNSENYFSILNTTKTYWPDIDLVDKLEMGLDNFRGIKT